MVLAANLPVLLKDASQAGNFSEAIDMQLQLLRALPQKRDL